MIEFARVADTESINPKSFLPLPIVQGDINRVEWIPLLRRQKKVHFSKAPTSLIDRIHYLKRNSKKSERKTKPRENSVLRRFVNYLQSRRDHRDVIKITTVVEHIRRRSKRDIERSIETVTPSNERNFSKNQLRSQRIENIEGEFGKLTSTRRHRRSTVDATSKDRKTRAYDKRDDSNETRKPLYTPVFKECNETTAASEIDDLNILPPKSKYSKPQNLLDTKKVIDLPQIDNKNLKLSALTNADGAKKLLKSPSSTLQQSGYVNLRDHQEESRSKNQSGETGRDSSTLGYPKDIKPYNPDIIPYVDVPDYTDQREESLDEDDRRVAGEKYSIVEKNNGKQTANVNDDDDDVDVVDPGGPEASEPLPDQPKNPKSSRNRNKSKSTEDRYKDAQFGGGKNLNSSSQNGEDNNENDRSKEDKISSENSDEHIETQSKPLQKSQSLHIVDHEDEKADKVESEVQYHREDDKEPISNFEPVHFDIADYAKPFNYHKLFKGKKNHDDEKPDEFITEDLPESSHEMFSEQYEKLVAVEPEDFRFEEKEFFQPILDHAHDKPDNFDEEYDFLAKYFTPDVIDRFGNSRNEKLEEKESQSSFEEDKEESYETLPSNLRSKNRNSQVKNEKVNRKDRPKNYKNFWTLEYSFPPKKTEKYSGGRKQSQNLS